MTEPTFKQACKLILNEMETALAEVREDSALALVEEIVGARAVFVTGEGRSGLVARCFAMRLMHLGLSAHVVGETVTPALKKGDLLVAVSGRGESGITCTQAREARGQGARVAAVTASEGSSLASQADLALVLPAAIEGGRGGSQQFGGSLFEQCALAALDALVLKLQHRLGQGAEEMHGRHATVE